MLQAARKLLGFVECMGSMHPPFNERSEILHAGLVLECHLALRDVPDHAVIDVLHCKGKILIERPENAQVKGQCVDVLE
jgi:hypothetical protein